MWGLRRRGEEECESRNEYECGSAHSLAGGLVITVSGFAGAVSRRSNKIALVVADGEINCSTRDRPCSHKFLPYIVVHIFSLYRIM